MTKEEKSWILYDVANSAFVLIVVTAVMPIFFKDIASKGIADAISTANWGFANAFASLVLAIMAPLIGTIADYQIGQGWQDRGSCIELRRISRTGMERVSNDTC